MNFRSYLKWVKFASKKCSCESLAQAHLSTCPHHLPNPPPFPPPSSHSYCHLSQIARTGRGTVASSELVDPLPAASQSILNSIFSLHLDSPKHPFGSYPLYPESFHFILASSSSLELAVSSSSTSPGASSSAACRASWRRRRWWIRRGARGARCWGRGRGRENVGLSFLVDWFMDYLLWGFQAFCQVILWVMAYHCLKNWIKELLDPAAWVSHFYSPHPSHHFHSH